TRGVVLLRARVLALPAPRARAQVQRVAVLDAAARLRITDVDVDALLVARLLLEPLEQRAPLVPVEALVVLLEELLPEARVARSRDGRRRARDRDLRQELPPRLERARDTLGLDRIA